MDDRVARMEARLAQLESEVVHMRQELHRAKRGRGAAWGWRVLGAASLALALAGVTAAAASPTFTAKPSKTPFKVVDNSGKTVMSVTDGGTILRGPIIVRDKSDDALMYLGDDGHLSVGHGNTAAVILGVTPHGGQVSVLDKAGKTAEDMGVNSGRGFFEISGNSGSPAVQLAAHSSGGYFVVTNPTGHTGVDVGVTPDDRGLVRAFGPGGFNYLVGKK